MLPGCPQLHYKSSGKGREKDREREGERDGVEAWGERLSAPFSWLYVFVKRQGGQRQPQRQQQTRLAEWENNFLLVFVRRESARRLLVAAPYHTLSLARQSKTQFIVCYPGEAREREAGREGKGGAAV